VTTPDRETALKEFEAARAAFVDAYAGVPDVALAFLKPGESSGLRAGKALYSTGRSFSASCQVESEKTAALSWLFSEAYFHQMLGSQ